MISFKQYLEESRASLYHATFLHNAEKILEKNALIGTMQEQGESQKLNRKVIFVTRSFKHAQQFYGGRGIVVFEIDQTKLRSRYKVRPIKNWPDRRQPLHKPSYMTDRLGGNEFEEIVIADKITDFEDYIVAIHVSDKIDRNKYPMLFDSEKLQYS